MTLHPKYARSMDMLFIPNPLETAALAPVEHAIINTKLYGGCDEVFSATLLLMSPRVGSSSQLLRLYVIKPSALANCPGFPCVPAKNAVAPGIAPFTSDLF